MSRSNPKRRILIIGEGRETEYNYFVGFRKSFESELDAASVSITVRRGRGGDARSIVKTAIGEARRFEPNRKLGDRVFLLLDTEGVARAPELAAAEVLARQNHIEIVYSSPAFEYWLLCHFANIPKGYFKDCSAVIAELDKHWKIVCRSEYDKTDINIFDRLSSRLHMAGAQALDIDLANIRNGNVAAKSNPSSQVYELIASLIGVQSNERCPIGGNWKPLGGTRVSAFSKGDVLPQIDSENVVWLLLA